MKPNAQDMLELKVLFVDDERSFCTCAKEYLELKGCKVETAYDAETALDWLKRQPFDVLVSDICLPKISGITLLKTIRSRGSLTQVVMMSGYANKAIALECLRAGAADFLYKPYRMEALEKVLWEIKQKKGRWSHSGILEP